MPDDLQEALPLVVQISEADWNDFFRVRAYGDMEAEVDEEIRAARSTVAQGLPVTARWMISRTDGLVGSGGRDASAYLWWIARDSVIRSVTVYISESTMASADSGLPADVVTAKQSSGRSVVAGLLGLDDPRTRSWSRQPVLRGNQPERASRLVGFIAKDLVRHRSVARTCHL